MRSKLPLIHRQQIALIFIFVCYMIRNFVLLLALCFVDSTFLRSFNGTDLLICFRWLWKKKGFLDVSFCASRFGTVFKEKTDVININAYNRNEPSASNKREEKMRDSASLYSNSMLNEVHMIRVLSCCAHTLYHKHRIKRQFVSGFILNIDFFSHFCSLWRFMCECGFISFINNHENCNINCRRVTTRDGHGIFLFLFFIARRRDEYSRARLVLLYARWQSRNVKWLSNAEIAMSNIVGAEVNSKSRTRSSFAFSTLFVFIFFNLSFRCCLDGVNAKNERSDSKQIHFVTEKCTENQHVSMLRWWSSRRSIQFNFFDAFL